MRGFHSRSCQDGVAPVVAEVLLVAITVTISGFVYFTAATLTTQFVPPSRPFVALGQPQIRDGIATVTVVSVSVVAPASSYRVNLKLNGTLGHATTLAASGTAVALPVATATYRVEWTDLGGAGGLAGGDPITVAAAGGPLPTGAAFTLYLVWSDGAVLASVSWST